MCVCVYVFHLQLPINCHLVILTTYPDDISKLCHILRQNCARKLIYSFCVDLCQEATSLVSSSLCLIPMEKKWKVACPQLR